MPNFILTGDITYAGQVRVRDVDSPEAAVEKAEKGEFEVYDKVDKYLLFTWSGEEDATEKEE